jgi:GxxExxY protein
MKAGEPELICKEEVYRIVGAATEVANQLGCGFLEAVYQEALEFELAERQIPCEPQKRIAIAYKGHTLTKEYVADFLCYGRIIVELKAVQALAVVEEAQILNYLKATHLPVGLLLNFGTPRLEWKRYASTTGRVSGSTSL